jgi:hypothetical protein
MVVGRKTPTFGRRAGGEGVELDLGYNHCCCPGNAGRLAHHRLVNFASDHFDLVYDLCLHAWMG